MGSSLLESYKEEANKILGFFSNQDYDAALQLAEQCEVVLSQALLQILSIKSIVLVNQGKASEAERILRKGLKLNDNHVDLLFDLGCVLEHEGNYIEAISAYMKALAVSDDPNVKNKLKSSIHKLQTRIDVHKCNVCGNIVKVFLPWTGPIPACINHYKIIGSDLVNFSCPHCYAHDRERHLVSFFNKLDIWNKYIRGKSVLHIAPEVHIQKFINDLKPQKYVRGDLFPDKFGIIEKIDITDIKYADETFDFIICNHVLEHVPDDLKAMKEFHRVLKKGGRAILQTPFSPMIEKSYEDNSIITDDERLIHFGQEDHVRIYGLDLFRRLEDSGFKLDIVKSDSMFSDEEAHYYGFNNKEALIMVEKL